MAITSSCSWSLRWTFICKRIASVICMVLQGIITLLLGRDHNLLVCMRFKLIAQKIYLCRTGHTLENSATLESEDDQMRHYLSPACLKNLQEANIWWSSFQNVKNRENTVLCQSAQERIVFLNTVTDILVGFMHTGVSMQLLSQSVFLQAQSRNDF